MARRYYANAAPQRTLAGTITAGATSCTVSGSFAGWPTQFPFYAALDIGTASFEIVSVTNIVGSTATIVRAQDGTAAISHPGGATMDQVIVRQDFDEASAHINASTGVHGVSGSVVGSNDVQTLSNKTLTNPTVNGANVTGTWAGTQAAAGLTVTSPNIVTPSVTKGTHTGDAATAAVIAVAGPTNTLIAQLKNNAGTQIGTIDAVSGFTGPKMNGAIVPTTFANEAAATAALPSPATGTMVWITTPTGGGPAGLYYWTGAAWAVVTPGFLIGDAASVSSVTFSTTSAFASLASVTFTLPVQRRVRIVNTARYALASATGGRMQIIPAYNTGASVVIGSVVSLTNGQYHVSNFTGTAGASGSISGMTECTVLLAAGQYTAYATVTRVSGGSTTDSATAFYTAVYDAGAV